MQHLACTRKTSLPPHRDTRSTRQRASVVAPRRHPPHMPPHMPTHIHAPSVAHMDGGGVLTHGWPTCRRIPVAHTHTCHPPTQASEMSVRCSDARGCSSVLTKAYRHRRTRTGRQTVSSSSAAEQQQCRSAHACSCMKIAGSGEGGKDQPVGSVEARDDSRGASHLGDYHPVAASFEPLQSLALGTRLTEEFGD